jgi:hypothetical protein
VEFNFVDQGSGFYAIHTVNGTQGLCLNISTAASSPGDRKKIWRPGEPLMSRVKRNAHDDASPRVLA